MPLSLSLWIIIIIIFFCFGINYFILFFGNILGVKYKRVENFSRGFKANLLGFVYMGVKIIVTRIEKDLILFVMSDQILTILLETIFYIVLQEGHFINCFNNNHI